MHLIGSLLHLYYFICTYGPSNNFNYAVKRVWETHQRYFSCGPTFSSEKLHKNNTEQSPSGSVEEADKTSELSHIVNSEKRRESNGIWMGFGTD